MKAISSRPVAFGKKVPSPHQHMHHMWPGHKRLVTLWAMIVGRDEVNEPQKHAPFVTCLLAGIIRVLKH